MSIDPLNFPGDCQHDYKKLQRNEDRNFYACEKCGATKDVYIDVRRRE